MMTDARYPVASAAENDRPFYVFNAVLSASALGFLGWLLLVHEGGTDPDELAFLPALNAALNSLAAILLVLGWVAIRRRKPRVHRYFMVGAFAASALFLVSYVIHHYLHGDTRFAGDGAVKLVYLAILASHVLLSMTVVPLALTAFFLAYKKRFDRHKRVTKVLTPIWLYVSVTGVAIYFMLRGVA